MAVIAAPASVRVGGSTGVSGPASSPAAPPRRRAAPPASSPAATASAWAWAWARAARIRRRPGGGFAAVRWDSTTSCDGPHSLRKPCTVAQAGRASTRADRAEHGGAGDRRGEGHRGVELQRPRRDAGREQVVLDLLVDDDDDQHPQRADRFVEQGDQHRQHAGQVGADDREELGDQADPDAERHRVPQPDRPRTPRCGRPPTGGRAAPASRGSRRSCRWPAPTRGGPVAGGPGGGAGR